VATTEVSAFSARLRRCSDQSGKYQLDRSLGMTTSRVPARVGGTALQCLGERSRGAGIRCDC
jgi:hypothetical protein